MSSLYEQMISAAIDVQLQTANVDPTAFYRGETATANHMFTNVLPHHSGGCRLSSFPQATTMQQQLGSDNSEATTTSSNEPVATKQEMSSGGSSTSATAITTLTPEPTESASSSVDGGSPRSVCSTLTSEQVPDSQLLQAEHEAAEKAIACAECGLYFDGVVRQPKILDCIHTFCEPCLIRRQVPFSSTPPHLSITCPLTECGQVTVVTTVAALQTNIPALTMSVVAKVIQHLTSPLVCDCLMNQVVGYLCLSCHQLVCHNCAMTAHGTPQHVLEPLDSLHLNQNNIDATSVSRLVDRLRACRSTAPSLMTVMCPRHPNLPVFSYCETCSQPVCQDCTPNHFSTKVGDHVTIHLLKGFDAQTYKHECGFFAAYIKHIRQSVMQLRTSLDAANRAQAMLQDQHQNSNIAVLQQFDQYVAKASNLSKMYAEQSDDLLSGIQLAGGLDKFITDVDQLRDECRRLNTLFERARENCSAAEMSSLREWVKRKVVDIRQRCRSINQSVNVKRRHSLPLDMRPLVDNELPKLFDPRADSKISGSAAGFVPTNNYQPNPTSAQYSRFQPPGANMPPAQQSFQPSSSSLAPRFSAGSIMPRNQPDYFQQQSQPQQQQQQPQTTSNSGWPASVNSSAGTVAMSNPYYQRLINAFTNQQVQKQRANNGPTQQQGVNRPMALAASSFQQLFPSQLLGQPSSLMTPVSSASTPNFDLKLHGDQSAVTGQQLCNDGELVGEPTSGETMGEQQQHHQIESGVVTDSPLLMAPTSVAIPNRLQLRYIAKIGQFGEADGQFTEPSGIATNHQNQLVVADTNSHRIQVFNNHGAFLWRFGECGKRAGQVLYPNRIAIGPEGEYVFTERAPQCLVQVFDSQGGFLRRFGSGDLRHPRGLCIDPEGHVLVLECQVMSVTIYDMRGTRLRRFTFEGIRFPSSICVNDQQEIFIADNIQHYVYVYSYDGAMKRRIGGYPTINFPVGVAINHLGQLVVADNHNNFNITVFTQDGTPISGYESCVKHAQVLDVCLLNAGRAVAISCKDYRVYVYPYQDCTSASMLDVGPTEP